MNRKTTIALGTVAVVLAAFGTVFAPLAFASQDRDCADFTTRTELEAYHAANPNAGLDRDGDGVPCETSGPVAGAEELAPGQPCYVGTRTGRYVSDPAVPESDAVLCQVDVAPNPDPVTRETFRRDVDLDRVAK